MRLGIIDAGTNTFHLCIIELNKEYGYTQIKKKSVYVNLAQNGLGYIDSLAWSRAKKAIRLFKNLAHKWDIKYLFGFGTSGLRAAKNGLAFTRMIKAEFTIDIKIIDGKEEARLIYEGVKKSKALNKKTALITDIGGGSVELIIGNEEKIYWATSLPIGLGVLYHKFGSKHSFNYEQFNLLKVFISNQLNSLKIALRKFPVQQLIGTKGAFDILIENPQSSKDILLHSCSKSYLQQVYSSIIFSSELEREKMAMVPKNRANFTPLAIQLIKSVQILSNTNQINISKYALKEGIIQHCLYQAVRS